MYVLLSLHRRCHRHLRHVKHLSTTAHSQLHVPLNHPTFLVWASNTSLGKTLVSTGLAASSLLNPIPKPCKFLYLKPVQTGFPSDSDSSFVFHRLSRLSLLRRHNHPHFSLFSSNHILKASFPAANSALGQAISETPHSGMRDLGYYEEAKAEGDVGGGAASQLVCKTLYAWREAVSPHLAAERESGAVEDAAVLESLQKCLRFELEGGGEKGKETEIFCVVETAGGVASPGPSGSLQCDLYRPFRLPGILVGDGRLGGISGTISAYESLKLRGYDIAAVVFEDHGLINEMPLLSYLRNRVPVLVLPPVPKDLSNDLMEWFDESRGVFDSLKEEMLSAYSKRMMRLQDMPKKAGEIFWWPFTQHQLVPEEAVTVIDSRHGENFAVFKAQNNEFITQQFDACASWWTQGPDTTLQTELARDMGYAAARFGHVMFPENVYEPALECAELLLEGVGKGWASRTYFSDNGSTAIEIALKMAFRKFSYDHGILSDVCKDNTASRRVELMVLALQGSYHGDTLGAMEAQAPSSYTGFLQQPWYTGRGLFLDPPTVYMCNGVWKLSLPEALHLEIPKLENKAFSSRDEIFHKIRDKSDLARNYSSYISEQLSQYSGSGGFYHIGALIMEPVMLGSGGMHMIDPLFQRVLVNECRSQKIPVIFDEVFTGFWRLGRETAAELLGCVPDIACFAKLMTGGIIPLAATLATNAIFNSFLGESKEVDMLASGSILLAVTFVALDCISPLDSECDKGNDRDWLIAMLEHSRLKALLHGHSYTGHAMGCTAAVKSIKWFKDPQTNLNITDEGRSLRELWDEELVQQISSHPAVERVVALGTLFALELRAEGSNAGYASQYASSLLQNLRQDGIYTRPLGNVIYLMCGPCTSPEICGQLLVKLYKRLEDFDQFHQIREENSESYGG